MLEKLEACARETRARCAAVTLLGLLPALEIISARQRERGGRQWDSLARSYPKCLYQLLKNYR